MLRFKILRSFVSVTFDGGTGYRRIQTVGCHLEPYYTLRVHVFQHWSFVNCFSMHLFDLPAPLPDNTWQLLIRTSSVYWPGIKWLTIDQNKHCLMYGTRSMDNLGHAQCRQCWLADACTLLPNTLILSGTGTIDTFTRYTCAGMLMIIELLALLHSVLIVLYIYTHTEVYGIKINKFLTRR